MSAVASHSRVHFLDFYWGEQATKVMAFAIHYSYEVTLVYHYPKNSQKERATTGMAFAVSFVVKYPLSFTILSKKFFEEQANSEIYALCR
jgi:hypothetical protein